MWYGLLALVLIYLLIFCAIVSLTQEQASSISSSKAHDLRSRKTSMDTILELLSLSYIKMKTDCVYITCVSDSIKKNCLVTAAWPKWEGA